MQVIFQIITLVSCSSNSPAKISLSEENLETPSSTNPTLEHTTGDLNKESIDNTIKSKINIKKLKELCNTQKLRYTYLYLIVFRHNMIISFKDFPFRREKKLEEISKEDRKKELIKNISKLYKEMKPEDLWVPEFFERSEEEFENLSYEERLKIIDPISEFFFSSMQEEVPNENSKERLAEDECQILSDCKNFHTPLYDIYFILTRLEKVGGYCKEHFELTLSENKRKLMEILNQELQISRLEKIAKQLAKLTNDSNSEKFKKLKNNLLAKLNEFRDGIQQIIEELGE